jgi:hypothetical protein
LARNTPAYFPSSGVMTYIIAVKSGIIVVKKIFIITDDEQNKLERLSL